jgi:TnpA family transposase
VRFVVPKRTINAGPSPKYYHFKRGITWLNAVNDQVAGIGQMVVPGTPRDSLHILDTLLNLDAGARPEMVATDNASYSDMVFGLLSCSATTSHPASATWPTSGSGGRRCPEWPPAATARWSRWPATRST